MHDLAFLVRNGGAARAMTCHIEAKGVVITLQGLDTITFSKDKTSITYGGGTSTRSVILAADKEGVYVPTGKRNCVGASGEIQGGGFGHLMGLYGFGVDNLLSVNLVMASGDLIRVDSSNAD